MKKVITTCLSCKKSFETYASQKRKFCSKKCMHDYLQSEEGSTKRSNQLNETRTRKGTTKKETRRCLQCKKTFQCIHSDVKSFCSKSCRYTYLSVHKNDMLIKQHITNLNKYGYEHPTKNKNIVENIRKTVATIYGTKHPRFSADAQMKKIRTCIIKYNKPYAPSSFTNTSKDEKDLLGFIRQLIPEECIEENNRTILEGKEVDIYIPSKKLAIEYDGLFYHSEMAGHKDRRYHLNKTIKCLQKGIRLIHIFSDEWINKRSICENRLRNILHVSKNKIYARKCNVISITSQESNAFLNTYHIQGEDKSRIKLGLLYNEELIAVMTFSIGRNMMGTLREENSYELSRYASKNNVVGGASKLLHHFIKHYKPLKIISYADRRWSEGNLYNKLGFTQMKYSAPSYWYTTDYRQRLYRYNFRKSILIKNGCDSNKSEWENMQMLGYDRIWDCGTIKFELIPIYNKH